jgi:hypothetical protein
MPFMLINNRIHEMTKMPIKKAVVILTFIFNASHFIFAQDTIYKERPDTLKKKVPINRSLLRGFDTLGTLSPSLRKSSLYTDWYLRQSIINLPPSLSYQFQQQIDVVSPWEAEVARDNDLKTLRYMLQAVSAGGTAYILYEHIKRYGLK